MGDGAAGPEERPVVLEGELARFGQDRPPPGAGVVGVRAERRGQQPETWEEPEEGDRGQERVDRNCRQCAYETLHRSTVPRKRRTLNAMAGTTSTNSKTPRALPSPSSWPPPNDTRQSSRATTLALSCTEPGGMTRTRSKIFRTLMTRVTATTSSTGQSRGTVTSRNTFHSLAPSTRAASRVSRGMAASPAAMTIMAKPVQIHRNEPMIDGGTRAWASQ